MSQRLKPPRALKGLNREERCFGGFESFNSSIDDEILRINWVICGKFLHRCSSRFKSVKKA